MMKNLFFLFLGCFFVSSPLFGQAQDCAGAQSNNDRSKCLEQELHAAEAKMDQALKRAIADFLPALEEQKELPVLPKMDRRFIKKHARLAVVALKTSQIKWLSYRESACSVFEHKYAGGNISAEIIPECKLELARQRTKWLQDLVQ